MTITYVNKVVERMFPRSTPNGKRIVLGENCQCEHSRVVHQGEIPFMAGHGACTVDGCPCRKYSWGENVYKKEE